MAPSDQQLDIENLAKNNDDNKILDLRPNSMSEYIGQESIKQKLDIAIKASSERGEALGHIMLFGGPSSGKTSLSNIIAKSLGNDYKYVNCPAITKQSELIEVIIKTKKKGVICLDECHQLSRALAEILYPVLELGKLTFSVANKQSVTIDLPPLTIICCTTEIGKLPKSFVDRFDIVHAMESFNQEELFGILKNSGKKLLLNITDESLVSLSQRCRGLPRIGNKLLKKVRDFAQVNRISRIDLDCLNATLHLEDLDELGLTTGDKNYMFALYDLFKGGPVGKEAISACINQNVYNVENYIEPWLLSLGFVIRSKQGRLLTANGIEFILKQRNLI